MSESNHKHIDDASLRELSQRIINSGELGRSRTYGEILDYLVECSIKGVTPKEMAIAVDVLGRSADFDVGKDSIVRVHIYHLRNKLRAYFKKRGNNETWKIEIPKGQYLIVATPNSSVEESRSVSGKVLGRRNYTPWLGGILSVLLLMNLLLGYREEISDDEGSLPLFWQSVIADQRPVLLVIGNYYIFGELDESGNISRMIRDFDINSEQDIVSSQVSQLPGSDKYFNLDLSYIPTSAAPALIKLAPVLNAIGAERLEVKMASELEIAELAGKHLVYIGYLSGMEGIADLVLSASGLEVGSTYDELINIESGERYISSSGLSIGENSFRDYGLVSNLVLPGGARLILIAGMRDEGLLNVSDQVMAETGMRDLNTEGDFTPEQSFEALYEVQGFDGTNFDAELVYSHVLDPVVIRQALLGFQNM